MVDRIEYDSIVKRCKACNFTFCLNSTMYIIKRYNVENRWLLKQFGFDLTRSLPQNRWNIKNIVLGNFTPSSR